MILVIAEAIPLIIVWKVLVVVERVLVLMIDEVEITPFTLDVRVLVAEERLLVVLDASRLLKFVEVATPFTVEVRIDPLVDRALDLITVVVADTPLIVVVSTLLVTS